MVARECFVCSNTSAVSFLMSKHHILSSTGWSLSDASFPFIPESGFQLFSQFIGLFAQSSDCFYNCIYFYYYVSFAVSSSSTKNITRVLTVTALSFLIDV